MYWNHQLSSEAVISNHGLFFNFKILTLFSQSWQIQRAGEELTKSKQLLTCRSIRGCCSPRLCLGNSRARGSFCYMGVVPEIWHWGLWKGYCLKGTNQCWHKGISQVSTNPKSPQSMQKPSIKSKITLNSFSIRAITDQIHTFPGNWRLEFTFIPQLLLWK